MSTLKSLINTHEFVLLGLIVMFLVGGQFVNPSFLTLGNLFDLLQSSIALGLFALGVFVALISGGIDISSSAVGVFSLYVTTKFLFMVNSGGGTFVALIIAGLIGLALGLFNGIFIAFFDFPALIVTLATLNLFPGFLISFIGSKLFNTLPSAMVQLQEANLVTVQQGRFQHSLPTAILLLLVVSIVTWALMKYTTLGRGIRAIGGDPASAKKVGFNPKKIKLFIYPYAGMLYGLAGLTYGSFARVANPLGIVGKELTILAAVVLGGASITGGSGTVVGTLLGVFLITLINKNLIMLGIPSYWRQMVIGFLIILGVSVTTYRERRTS